MFAQIRFMLLFFRLYFIRSCIFLTEEISMQTKNSRFTSLLRQCGIQKDKVIYKKIMKIAALIGNVLINT